MSFIQFVGGDGAIPVAVGDLNLARSLDAVGGRSVSRHIERLVGVLGPVVAVRAENLILGVDVVVHASKTGAIAHEVVDGFAVVFIEAGLHEVEQGHTLAVGAGIDLGIGGDGPIENRARPARSA